MSQRTEKNALQNQSNSSAYEGDSIHPVELFRYALTHFEGAFSIKQIHQAFKAQGLTQARISAIGQEYEDQTVEIDGQAYRLEPGRGSKPRTLIRVTSKPPTPAQDSAAVTEDTSEDEPPGDNALAAAGEVRDRQIDVSEGQVGVIANQANVEGGINYVIHNNFYGPDTPNPTTRSSDAQRAAEVATRRKPDQSAASKLPIQDRLGTMLRSHRRLIIGIIILCVVVFGGLIWLLQSPMQPDESQFSIAVATFTVLDEAGQEIESELGQVQSQRIAGFIAVQRDTLTEIIKSPVNILGDDEAVMPVAPSDEVARAEMLKADVLIYGTMQRTQLGHWVVAPSFYLTDEVVKQADELRGEYALGTSIPLIPDNRASEGNLNAIFRARIRALTQILMGLWHYANGSNKGYEAAAALFQQAADDPEWGASSEHSGQEILYLFLGNAYGKIGSLSDDVEKRNTLFALGKRAYYTAIMLNEDYSRSFNGLGSLLFQEAQPFPDMPELCGPEWDWGKLAQSNDYFKRALNVSTTLKPPSGNVDLRANLGLGRNYYYLGLCQHNPTSVDFWELSRLYHRNVIEEYNRVPIQHLQGLASIAHLDLGDMALQEALWLREQGQGGSQADQLLAAAIEDYEKAFNLIKDTYTEEALNLAGLILIRLGVALCTSEHLEVAIDHLDMLNQESQLEPAMYKNLQQDLKEACNE